MATSHRLRKQRAMQAVSADANCDINDTVVEFDDSSTLLEFIYYDNGDILPSLPSKPDMTFVRLAGRRPSLASRTASDHVTRIKEERRQTMPNGKYKDVNGLQSAPQKSPKVGDSKFFGNNSPKVQENSLNAKAPRGSSDPKKLDAILKAPEPSLDSKNGFIKSENADTHPITHELGVEKSSSISQPNATCLQATHERQNNRIREDRQLHTAILQLWADVRDERQEWKCQLEELLAKQCILADRLESQSTKENSIVCGNEKAVNHPISTCDLHNSTSDPIEKYAQSTSAKIADQQHKYGHEWLERHSNDKLETSSNEGIDSDASSKPKKRTIKSLPSQPSYEDLLQFAYNSIRWKSEAEKIFQAFSLLRSKEDERNEIVEDLMSRFKTLWLEFPAPSQLCLQIPTMNVSATDACEDGATSLLAQRLRQSQARTSELQRTYDALSEKANVRSSYICRPMQSHTKESIAPNQILENGTDSIITHKMKSVKQFRSNKISIHSSSKVSNDKRDQETVTSPDMKKRLHSRGKSRDQSKVTKSFQTTERKTCISKNPREKKTSRPWIA